MMAVCGLLGILALSQFAVSWILAYIVFYLLVESLTLVSHELHLDGEHIHMLSQ